MIILRFAVGRDWSALRLYKTLRLVNRAACYEASEHLAEEFLKLLEKKLSTLQTQLSEKWQEHPSAAEGAWLESMFSDLTKRAEDVQTLQRALKDKKASRKQLSTLAWDKLPSAAAESILKLASYGTELGSMRTVAEALRSTDTRLQQFRHIPAARSPLYETPDPLRLPAPPRRPAPYDPYTGEPVPDHEAPPDWERDRQPGPLPPLPGGYRDPFDPFAPNAPFAGPPRRPGRGGGGGGLNPFNPHPPPSFGGPRFM